MIVQSNSYYERQKGLFSIWQITNCKPSNPDPVEPAGLNQTWYKLYAMFV